MLPEPGRFSRPLPQNLNLFVVVVEEDSDDFEASGGESEALALAPVLDAGERLGAREPEEVRRFRRRDQQRQRRRHEVLPPHEIVA